LIYFKVLFFQPWVDCKKVLEVCTPHMHRVEDADGTVYEAIRRIKPDYFGNEGDRKNKILLN